jgi:hypothetical protein
MNNSLAISLPVSCDIIDYDASFETTISIEHIDILFQKELIKSIQNKKIIVLGLSYVNEITKTNKIVNLTYSQAYHNIYSSSVTGGAITTETNTTNKPDILITDGSKGSLLENFEFSKWEAGYNSNGDMPPEKTSEFISARSISK